MAQDKEPVKSTNKAPCSLPNSDTSSAALRPNSIGDVKKTRDSSTSPEERATHDHGGAITLHNLLLSGKEDKGTTTSLTNGSSAGKIRPVSMQSLLSNGLNTVTVEAAAARLRNSEVTITKVKTEPISTNRLLSQRSHEAAQVTPDMCVIAEDEDIMIPPEPVCVIKEEPPEADAGCDIAYVCRGCGEEFHSSALGGYYYCSECSGLYQACSICQVQFYCPPSSGQTLCSSCAETAPKHKRDRRCMACFTTFRCGSGEWNYCARCVAKSGTEAGSLFNCATCGLECRTTLENCFHCARCTSLYTVTRRSTNAQYQRYTCTVCNGIFYSCGRERQKCSNCVRRGRPPAQSFVRRDVVYVRRACITCNSAFYSSACGSDQCRKCRTQDGSVEDESSGEEEDKWANVVYEKYVCQVCGNSFYSRAGDYRFCGDCNPETRIEKRPLWRCAHCPFTANLKRELRRHILSIPRSIKCRCSVCSATAPASDEPVVKKVYKCKRCDYTTAHRKRYKTHKQHHKAPPETHVIRCKFCNFSAPGIPQIRRHVIKEHRKVSVCRFCDYMTKQRGRMKRHVKEVHPDERTPMSKKERLICPRCNYTTVQPTRFQNHVSVCTVEPEDNKKDDGVEDTEHCGGPQMGEEKDIDSSDGAMKRKISDTKIDSEGELTEENGMSGEEVAETPSKKRRKNNSEDDSMSPENTAATNGEATVVCPEEHEGLNQKSNCDQAMSENNCVQEKDSVKDEKKESETYREKNEEYEEKESSADQDNNEEQEEKEKELEPLYRCSECPFYAGARKIIRDHIVYSH